MTPTQKEDNFPKCLSFVLKEEGGFVNDPVDKGGMTYKGICRKYYPDLFMWNIVDSILVDGGDKKQINRQLSNSYKVDTEISDVYRKEYWDKCNCDDLEYPLCLCVFDTAVNMGVGQAKRFLVLTSNPEEYLTLRESRYHLIVDTNPSQKKFLNGWMNRVNKLRKEISNV